MRRKLADVPLCNNAWRTPTRFHVAASGRGSTPPNPRELRGFAGSFAGWRQDFHSGFVMVQLCSSTSPNSGIGNQTVSVAREPSCRPAPPAPAYPRHNAASCDPSDIRPACAPWRRACSDRIPPRRRDRPGFARPARRRHGPYGRKPPPRAPLLCGATRRPGPTAPRLRPGPAPPPSTGRHAPDRAKALRPTRMPRSIAHKSLDPHRITPHIPCCIAA